MSSTSIVIKDGIVYYNKTSNTEKFNQMMIYDTLKKRGIGGILMKIKDYMLGLGTGIVIGVIASQATNKMDFNRSAELVLNEIKTSLTKYRFRN